MNYLMESQTSASSSNTQPVFSNTPLQSCKQIVYSVSNYIKSFFTNYKKEDTILQTREEFISKLEEEQENIDEQITDVNYESINELLFIEIGSAFRKIFDLNQEKTENNNIRLRPLGVGNEEIVTFFEFIHYNPKLALPMILWLDTFHDFKYNRTEDTQKLNNKIDDALKQMESYDKYCERFKLPKTSRNKYSLIQLYRDSFFDLNNRQNVNGHYHYTFSKNCIGTILENCYYYDFDSESGDPIVEESKDNEECLTNINKCRYMKHQCSKILFDMSQKIIEQKEFESELLYSYLLYNFFLTNQDIENKMIPWDNKIIRRLHCSLFSFLNKKKHFNYYAKDVDKSNVTNFRIQSNLVVLPASLFDANSSNSSKDKNKIVNIPTTTIPFISNSNFIYEYKKDGCLLNVKGYRNNDDLIVDSKGSCNESVKDCNFTLINNKYESQNISLDLSNAKINLTNKQGMSVEQIVSIIADLISNNDVNHFLFTKNLTNTIASINPKIFDLLVGLKRIGDFGQILQCKQLGIPLFTQDSMQILISMICNSSVVWSPDGHKMFWYDSKDDCIKNTSTQIHGIQCNESFKRRNGETYKTNINRLFTNNIINNPMNILNNTIPSEKFLYINTFKPTPISNTLGEEILKADNTEIENKDEVEVLSHIVKSFKYNNKSVIVCINNKNKILYEIDYTYSDNKYSNKFKNTINEIISDTNNQDWWNEYCKLFDVYNKSKDLQIYEVTIDTKKHYLYAIDVKEEESYTEESKKQIEQDYKDILKYISNKLYCKLYEKDNYFNYEYFNATISSQLTNQLIISSTDFIKDESKCPNLNISNPHLKNKLDEVINIHLGIIDINMIKDFDKKPKSRANRRNTINYKSNHPIQLIIDQIIETKKNDIENALESKNTTTKKPKQVSNYSTKIIENLCEIKVVDTITQLDDQEIILSDSEDENENSNLQPTSLDLSQITIEDESTPIEEQPMEDESTPIEEQPMEDESTPIEEQTMEDESTPIEEQPMEDESTPIEEQPMEDESTPIEEQTMEDESTPIEEQSIKAKQNKKIKYVNKFSRQNISKQLSKTKFKKPTIYSPSTQTPKVDLENSIKEVIRFLHSYFTEKQNTQNIATLNTKWDSIRLSDLTIKIDKIPGFFVNELEIKESDKLKTIQFYVYNTFKNEFNNNKKYSDTYVLKLYNELFETNDLKYIQKPYNTERSSRSSSKKIKPSLKNQIKSRRKMFRRKTIKLNAKKSRSRRTRSPSSRDSRRSRSPRSRSKKITKFRKHKTK